jgi:hypothetical protein
LTTGAGVVAASAVVNDLVAQGWTLTVEDRAVSVEPPTANADPEAERARVRTQELLKRNEQLRQPSVARFVRQMEEPREFRGRFVSIFSLMRDGEELADLIARLEDPFDERAVRGVVNPYVQVVSPGDRCEHTGLRLTDVWRYFRLTWSNQHASTPGRSMMLLVRDRAAPEHPIVGIAALSSAIVQIRERDNWIGWQSEDILREWDRSPSARSASWIWRRIEDSLRGIHLDDLIADGIYWTSLWNDPTVDAIRRLREDAERSRRDHHRFANRTTAKADTDLGDEHAIRQRSESDLFRSKRAAALADLLEARLVLGPYLNEAQSSSGLRRALGDKAARRAIAGVVRKAKGDAVGTEIADLSVCGAVPPYNDLLGGKLVSMLAVSPTVVRAYHDRYGDYASHIASAMAGRVVRRRNNLVYVGTTSLYGVNSSQYNRLALPPTLLGGNNAIRYQQLGRSRSFGTSHLSDSSVQALVRLAEESRNGVRVNSIFGEGVNPKLRKIREGLDLLGWPADELLQHRRPRIVYGVCLVDNLLPYLLGFEETPRFRFDARRRDDVDRIVGWWAERWLARRLASDEALARIRGHSLRRPVRHGARVVLPERNPGTDGSDG